METLKEEEPAEEQSPERRCVEALLDLSEEEEVMKELETLEYRCCSGWEEAVHGWARAAPLSCILMSRKPKCADVSPPTYVDPPVPSSELRGEAHVGPQSSSKKPTPSNQQPGSWGNHELQKTTSTKPSQLHHVAPRHPDSRAPRPQRHRAESVAVPIRNFTFLPPIVSSQKLSGKKVPEGEPENVLLFDKKSRTRGSRVEIHSESPTTPEFWTCRHHPALFSAVTVPASRRYQEPSRTDTLRHRYSLDTSLTQAGGQAQMFPNKTVCTS